MKLDRYQLPGGVRPRVLIVDDEPFHLRVLAGVLRSDHDVLVAHDGPQALDVARRERPDLILLDVVMPGMDGLEVCRRIQSDPLICHIPVVFVTSNDSAAEETAGLDAGAVDFIAKPIVPAVVRARVRTHLVLKLQSDQLRAMAFVDGLTGVANRRRFDEQLELEWQTCEREQRPLGLIMIDVDYFKKYNDRYGHQAGDQALCAVADRMRACVRSRRDQVARLGGEEFAVLLPDCGPDDAHKIAERLRQAVFDAGIPHAASTAAPVVTISAGVATAVPAPTSDPQKHLGLADSRLYLAKETGRNRVAER